MSRNVYPLIAFVILAILAFGIIFFKGVESDSCQSQGYLYNGELI